MNYQLCSKILHHKHCTDDVRELIVLYKKATEHVEDLVFQLDQKRQEIMILEAENRILKETDASN